MPKMHTEAHFEVDMPHATADEMKHAEQLMRDPSYVADALAAINKVANEHAQKAGFPHHVEITGSIGSVTHHP